MIVIINYYRQRTYNIHIEALEARGGSSESCLGDLGLTCNREDFSKSNSSY